MSVYFLRHGQSSLIKIGHATDPHDRLRLLQTGNPYRLLLVAVAPGGDPEEKALHRRFAAHRVNLEWEAWFRDGEWFRQSAPGLLDLMLKHRVPPYAVGLPPGVLFDFDLRARGLTAQRSREVLSRAGKPSPFGKYVLEDDLAHPVLDVEIPLVDEGEAKREKLLTVAFVAEQLGLTPATIHGWVQQGRLRAVRLGGTKGGRLRIPETEFTSRLAEWQT